MKIERFIVALTTSDKFIELQPDPEGSLCFASEVVKLEAKCAELETKCAELLEAATNALWWWDSGNKISPKPSDIIGRLRSAIAKAKGESDE